MTISFPGSPSDGQIYSPASPAPAYVYSATSGLWNVVGSTVTTTIATIDLGSTPDSSFSITVTDATITTASMIDAEVLVTTTSDNSAENHAHAAASWRLSCLAESGSFTLAIDTLFDMCWGTFKIRYSH